MAPKCGPLQRGKLQLEKEMWQEHVLFPHLDLPFLYPSGSPPGLEQREKRKGARGVLPGCYYPTTGPRGPLDLTFVKVDFLPSEYF